MTTDFSYGGKQILSNGPFKPNGKDMPNDARTRVECYADITTIPNPHVGLKITVKVDETNDNKMTDYIVKSLKANSMGIANSAIDEVVRYVDYLGASSGGSVSQEDINTAVNNYLTEHPVTGGATAEQAAQIEANRTAIGDANSGLTKEINDINNALTRVDAITLNGKKFSNPMTKEEYDSIVDKDENTIYLVDDNNVITGIPDYSTADANKLLAVNSTGTALAWVDAPSGSGTGATAEQVAQIQANTAAIGTEELSTTAKTLKGAINEVFQDVGNGKTLIASAITDKGITTSNDATFQVMADNIKNIVIANNALIKINNETYKLSVVGGKIIAQKQEEVLEGLIEGRLLIWNDEFNGSSLNTDNWNYEIGYIGNNEEQYYTNRTDNVHLENGNLVITAKKEEFNGKSWTSGRINTNNKFESDYGRLEAKIKLPNNQGCWSAFWTLGAGYEIEYLGNAINRLGQLWPVCGEIDIFEHCRGERSVGATVHYASELTNNTHVGKGFGSKSNIDVTQYHVYAIERTQETIKLYIDNELLGTFNNSEADVGNFNPFRKPHFIVLNLAMGGAMGGTIDSNLEQASMYVDYVRFYAPESETQKIIENSISFNTNEIRLDPGDSYQLDVTFSPQNTHDKTIIWNSEDYSVADCYGGKIKAKTQGTINVKAISKNKKECICKVIVGNGETANYYSGYIDDSGNVVSLENTYYSKKYYDISDSTEITINSAIEVSVFRVAFYDIDRNFISRTYSSYNGGNKINSYKFSTPSSAKYVVVGFGDDGSAAPQEVFKNISITTNADNKISTTAIALSNDTLVFTDNNPITLTATVEPSNTTDTLLWESNNPSIATVQNGIVSPVSNGECIITATSGNFSDSCNITVNIPDTPVTVDYSAGYINDNGVLTARANSYVDNNFRDVSTFNKVMIKPNIDVVNIRFNHYDENKNFIKREYGTGLDSGIKSEAFSLETNTKYVRIGFDLLPSTTINDDVLASLFSTYTITEASLLYESGSLDYNNGNEIDSSNRIRTDFIKIDQLNTSISSSSTYHVVATYDSNKNYISRYPGDLVTSLDYSFSPNVCYIRLIIDSTTGSGGNLENTKIKINENTYMFKLRG